MNDFTYIKSVVQMVAVALLEPLNGVPEISILPRICEIGASGWSQTVHGLCNSVALKHI